MKKFIILALFSMLTSLANADMREIILKDGSVISGDIKSFDGQQYTVKSPSLGTIQLPNQQVELIRNPAAAKNNATQPNFSSSNLNALQQQLTANPEIMKLIEALQNDPQVRALLNDPQIVQAVMAGDINALMGNQKFKALADNPSIQKIINKSKP